MRDPSNPGPFGPALLSCLIGAALAPGAASSDDDVDDGLEVAGEASLFGLVTLRQPDEGEGDDGDAYASFVRFDRPLPTGQLLADFRPEGDTCTVETDDDSDDDDDDLFPHAAGRPFDFTSAGDDIAFASADDTFLTLALFERPGYAGYRPESRPLPTPFPTDLTVSIEGDDFPGFDAVPVVDVDALVVSAPADDEGVPADADFRWEAGSSDDARVEIELEFDDADDGDDIDVTCSAIDDGTFALPRDVLDRLPAGATAEIEMQRVGLTVRGGDEALLVVKREAAGGL